MNIDNNWTEDNIKLLTRIKKDIEAENKAHDKKAFFYKWVGIWLKTPLIILSAFVTLFAGVGDYIDPNISLWIILSLNALSSIILGFYIYIAPEEVRGKHIQAKNGKCGSLKKINIQFSLPVNERNQFSIFYDWIADELASLAAHSPYISDNLTKKMRKELSANNNITNKMKSKRKYI